MKSFSLMVDGCCSFAAFGKFIAGWHLSSCGLASHRVDLRYWFVYLVMVVSQLCASGPGMKLSQRTFFVRASQTSWI